MEKSPRHPQPELALPPRVRESLRPAWSAPCPGAEAAEIPSPQRHRSGEVRRPAPGICNGVLSPSPPLTSAAWEQKPRRVFRAPGREGHGVGRSNKIYTFMLHDRWPETFKCSCMKSAGDTHRHPKHAHRFLYIRTHALRAHTPLPESGTATNSDLEPTAVGIPGSSFLDDLG